MGNFHTPPWEDSYVPPPPRAGGTDTLCVRLAIRGALAGAEGEDPVDCHIFLYRCSAHALHHPLEDRERDGKKCRALSSSSALAFRPHHGDTNATKEKEALDLPKISETVKNTNLTLHDFSAASSRTYLCEL